MYTASQKASPLSRRTDSTRTTSIHNNSLFLAQEQECVSAIAYRLSPVKVRGVAARLVQIAGIRYGA